MAVLIAGKRSQARYFLFLGLERKVHKFSAFKPFFSKSCFFSAPSTNRVFQYIHVAYSSKAVKDFGSPATKAQNPRREIKNDSGLHRTTPGNDSAELSLLDTRCLSSLKRITDHVESRWAITSGVDVISPASSAQ